MDALVLENISHRYDGTLAVDRVSLTIGAGELVCLLGPSGCGKTTMLRVAAGLERLQSGAVYLGGQVAADAAHDLPPEERSIGLVFQDYALFPHLSVLANVAFGLRGQSGRKREEMAREALGQVGMADYASAYPHTLSGGQQQRVALARALAPRPRVVLLDEPFSGLDSRLRYEVRDQALHVLKRADTATLMVTHDPEEAMFMADRIVLMRDGRVVQVGAPTELYFNPTCAFAAGFFGEVNHLRATARGGRVRTPLADLDANGAPEGGAVDVLVRPEAIRLLPPGEGIGSGHTTARVIAAKLLGRSSLIHLEMPDDGAALHLHARVPGRFLPSEGDSFSIDLDRAQAFVFPLGEAAGEGHS